MNNTMQQAQVQQNQPQMQQPVQAQIVPPAQAQTVTQAFFNENYAAPFYVQSKVNQAIHPNTIAFSPALVQKKGWKTFERPIENITCNADGNIAVVWSREKVSIGNRNSAELQAMQFPLSLCHGTNIGRFARSTALWQPNGDLTIANNERIVFHWPKTEFPERFDSGRCSSVPDKITCITQNATKSCIGLKNGMICIKSGYHYLPVFSPKNQRAVQDIAFIDDNHLVAIYQNNNQMLFLDISKFEMDKFDFSQPEIEQNKVTIIPQSFDGVSCSAIAVLNQRTIILGSTDGMMRTLEKEQDQWVVKRELRGATSAVAKIIPCGECIIIVGKKDPAFYIRYSTGTLISKINSPDGAFVVSVSTFPDGSFAVAYSNSAIELFEINTQALQELQKRSSAELDELSWFIGYLTNLELMGIPRDTQHLGAENIALLRRLPAPLRNSLIQNYRCFIDTTNWDAENPAPAQAAPLPQQPPQRDVHRDAHIENAPGQPLPQPAKNFLKQVQQFFSKNKITMSILAVTAFVLLTGKPTKVARKLRPIVRFPLTLYSYLFGMPHCASLSTVPFESHVSIS